MASEVLRLVPAAERSGRVVIDSEFFGVELERLAYYDVLMRPHAGSTTLIGFMQCRGRLFGAVALGRCRGSRGFSGEEVASLRRVLSTLALSLFAYGRWSAAEPPQRPAQETALALGMLTAREREVLGYLHLGYTNQQIALALGSSPRTVRNQLSRVYDKLGVGSRAEAVAVCHGTNVPWSGGGRR